MKSSYKLFLIVILLLSSCGRLAKATPGIFGSVIDSDGKPVDGINIAVTQGGQRVDVYSAPDGSFSAELPASTNPNWRVEIVGINCTSRVMSDCVLTGYFESPQSMDVTVPLSAPVKFVFEKATTSITGKVPASGIRIFAIRNDGATSWGESSGDGTFALPASDGIWDVYAKDLISNQEGDHVSLEIANGNSNFVDLKAP